MRDCVTHHVCDCIEAGRDRLRARVAELEAERDRYRDALVTIAREMMDPVVHARRVLDGAAPDQENDR